MDIELYPPSLRRIIGVIGEESGARLLAKCGGTRVFVPKREPRETSKLVRAIGMDAALLMVKAFRGTSLTIPRAASALKEVRNEKIRRAYDDGAKATDLAKRYSLTERSIYEILCK
ncbi:hypothetical protein N9937_01500 [bacterium]|nr:hypothetical protein [bacterium]